MSKHLSSTRAKASKTAKEKRIRRNKRKRYLLEAVASGRSYKAIAEEGGISVSTLKRHVNTALAEHPVEAPHTFVDLQRARIERMMTLADVMIEDCDARGIKAMLSLMPQLERYWGLQHSLAASRNEALEAQISAPKLMKSNDRATQLPPPEPLAADAAALPSST